MAGASPGSRKVSKKSVKSSQSPSVGEAAPNRGGLWQVSPFYPLPPLSLLPSPSLRSPLFPSRNHSLEGARSVLLSTPIPPI